jgi:hypothetical protein
MTYIVDVTASTQSFDVAVTVEENIYQVDVSVGDAVESKYWAEQAELSAELAQEIADSINVLTTPLTGYVVGDNSPLSATDTVLDAFQKVQGQINNIPTQDPVTIGTANGLSLADQVLSLGLASGSANGALSSTDWSTFNAKIDLASLLTGFSVGANTSIASTDSILQAFNKTQGQINARVSGTGTAGQVAFWSGTGSQSGSNNLFWDSVNGRLGIGTNAPFQSIDVASGSMRGGAFIIANIGTISSTGASTINVGSNLGIGLARAATQALDVNGNIRLLADSGNGIFGLSGAGNAIYALTRSNTPNSGSFNINILGGLAIGVGNATAGNNFNLQLFNTGNLVIQNGGTFTDAGFRLDVNGTARVQGNTTVIGTLNINSGNSLRLNNTDNTINGSIVISSPPQIGTAVTNTWLGGTVFSWNNTGLVLNHAATNNNIIFLNRSALSSGTTGAAGLQFPSGGSFAPTTGNNNFQVISINTSYNSTGGTNTITGFLYNPTLTSLTGVTHRAIQTVTGDVLLGTTSGSVGIGANTTINASAILELTSTTRGFLPPRMTTAQRDAIASPAQGLQIFNITTTKTETYDGTTWQAHW